MRKQYTRIICLLLCCVGLSLVLPLSAHAGEWKKDRTGWWYADKPGSYLRATWSFIDGYWYYFDDNGYMAESKWIGNYYVGANGAMYVDTVTPDGYRVGADGAWIPDKSVPDESTLQSLDRIGIWIHMYYSDYASLEYGTFTREQLTAEAKAFLLFAYQYNMEDSRIKRPHHGYYHYATRAHLAKIMTELTGYADEADMDYFFRHFTTGNIPRSGAYQGMYEMPGTGDFGDAGSVYLGTSSLVSCDGGRLHLSGDVMVYSPVFNEYLPEREYHLYFTASDKAMYGWLFEKLIIS